MSNFVKISDGIQFTLLATSNAPSSPVNGMMYYDSTLNLFQLYQNGSWISASSGGTISSGTAGNLTLYPSTGTTVSDTYTQNSNTINISIAAQATRSVGLVYTLPNPGDAVAAANIILSQGAQTIAGAITFSAAPILSAGATSSDDIKFATNKGVQSTSASSTLNIGTNGNATTINIGTTGSTINLQGSVTEVKTTNTYVDEVFITLNRGGASSSGTGSGFKIEEGGSATGYITSSAARTGFDVKAPATAGVATIRPNTASHTYDLPAADGTLLTAVSQDSAPSLGGDLDVNGHVLKSSSNGNIQIAPNGTGKIQIANQGTTSRYLDMAYFDAVTLTASTTAVASSFTFDSTLFKAQEIMYTIVEASTNERRQGTLRIVGNGASGSASTTTFVTDSSVETADIGVTWSVAISSNNIQLSYTTTAHNKTMQALVKRFLP